MSIRRYPRGFFAGAGGLTDGLDGAVDRVEPGGSLTASTKAAEINRRIVAAASTATVYCHKKVVLDSGVFYLETPIVLTLMHYVDLEMQEDTILIPIYTGAADDQLNYTIVVDGALDTSILNTTLTANAVRGRRSFTVTNGGSLPAGAFVLISGANGAEDAAGMSDGSAVLQELVKTDSTHVTGSTTVATAWTLAQNHGTTLITAKGVTPTVGVRIRGGMIRGSQNGVTTAVGVFVRYGVDVEVDGLAVEGCSRAAVEASACRGFWSDSFYNLGGSNAWYFLTSVLSFKVTNARGKDGVARTHALGVPRAQVYMRYRCSDGSVENCEFSCGWVGVFHSGGVNIKFSNLAIRDMEVTQALYDRWVASGEQANGGIVAPGFGSGHGPLSIAEFAFDCTYTNIHISGLTAPGTAGWADSAVFRARAWYLHDTKQLTASNVHLVGFDHLSNVAGMLCSDAEGSVVDLTVKGLTHALTFNNTFNDVRFVNTRVDATGGSATSAGTPLVLIYIPTATRGPRFEGMHLSNYNGLWFYIDPTQTIDLDFEIKNLINDNGQWSRVVMADSDGTNFAIYDIVEVDPTYTGAGLRVRTPSGTPGNRLMSVVGGGTGKVLVAPLPAEVAYVKKITTGTMNYGDNLVYSATRRCTTTTDGASAVGITLTRVASAGSENIIKIGQR